MTEREFPIRVTFRNMEPSTAVEEHVREAAAKLATFHDRIVACDVTIEQDHQRQHQGKLFQVRVDVKLPGAEIAVSRNPDADHAHENAYVAIHDAFDAAKRRLQDHLEKLREAARSPEKQPRGHGA